MHFDRVFTVSGQSFQVFLALLGMLAITPAVAVLPDNPTETIKTLYAQGQFEQAYELGRAAEFNWEGDPEFDFNYGLAAIESGHYEDAIFALERVVFLRPDILRLRLELARAHFLNENFVAARAEFQRVLDRSPPPNVQETSPAFWPRWTRRSSRSVVRSVAGASFGAATTPT